MALDYLFGSTPPPSVNTSVASSNGLPDWYQEYLRGIAGKGVAVAGNAEVAPVPQRSVAGFNQDQANAFQTVRNNQGVWRPNLDWATSLTQGIAPKVEASVDAANKAVAGPAANFTQNFQKYMSPYTQGVVDNIARLGNRNFQENLMPSVNASMIGTGQFGSTRNADVLGRTARDVQADITGAQAKALESGYVDSSNIFASDANRAQQQQQMQGSAALGGAGALTSGFSTAANGMGNLGQSYAALGLGDAQALGAVGATQQNLTQTGFDVNHDNALALQQQPWDNLGRLNSVVQGVPMPSGPTQISNGPLAGSTNGQGTLGALGQVYGAATAGRK